jgi:hypothetical protein
MSQFKPKITGEDTRFIETLGRRKVLEVIDEMSDLFLHHRVLMVGADHGFTMAPEVFQGVEVRAPGGQPSKSDPQSLGQGLRSLGGVAGVGIQQQGHWPGAVVPVNQLKKRLKVFGPFMLLGQKQRVASPQVQAAEDDPPRVLAADGYRRGFAPAGPTRPQGRQEQ